MDPEEARKPSETPRKVDRAFLVRGQERYQHLLLPLPRPDLGDGQGMIVKRGLLAAAVVPRAIGSATRPPGHFYHVITNGYGAMYSYASRVPPDDRWAIVAYIRALQLSQQARARGRPAPRSGQTGGEGAMSTDDLSIQDPVALAWLERVQRPALIAGGAGLVVCVLAAVVGPRWFFPSYLVGLPVLARDRGRLPGGGDAPPTRRRRPGGS